MRCLLTQPRTQRRPAGPSRSTSATSCTRRSRCDPSASERLAYSFDTRTLSFLKHPDLVAVVRTLGEHASVGAAFEAVGVEETRWPSFQRALATLETSEMIRAA